MTLDELYELGSFCREKGSEFQTFEETTQLQALCTIKLWQDLSKPDGKDEFCNWCVEYVSLICMHMMEPLLGVYC